MKQYKDILIIGLIFVVATSLLNHFGFWNAIGLSHPSGILTQGVAFLILMGLLQLLVFDPFLKIEDERAYQTKGRKQDAIEKQAQAQALLQKYEETIHGAKLKAIQAREAIAIDAEKEEKKTLLHAKKVSDESLKSEIQEIESKGLKAQKDLEKDIPDFAKAIYQNIITFDSTEGKS